MTHWLERLRSLEETHLCQRDPRPGISAYPGMPCAVFHYDPDDEFEVRQELRRLIARLSGVGKVVHEVSLADCLAEALAACAPVEALAASEQEIGLDEALQTVNQILAEEMPLDAMVLARMAAAQDPEQDLVFITRCGALFPFYRPYPLTEHLMNRVAVPTILFYPGERAGPTSLSFMKELPPDNNYRVTIF